MKRSEVATFLGMVSATDRRTVGDLDVQTWFTILPADITLAEAQTALIHYRKTSTDWLEPKHILDLVKLVRTDRLDPERRERLRRAGDPPIPDGLTWEREKEFRRLWCEHVKDGATKEAAAELTYRQMDLPPELPTADRKAELAAVLAKSKRVPPGHPATNRTEP